MYYRFTEWFGCSSKSSKDKSADVEGKREEESNTSTQETRLLNVGSSSISNHK